MFAPPVRCLSEKTAPFSFYSFISELLEHNFDSLQCMDYFAKRRQLGQRIVEMRKRQGISQTQLALMSDINKGYLSEIENGISNISLNKLFRIADSLGIPPAELFSGIGLSNDGEISNQTLN